MVKILCLEGNIGSGKSTSLEYLKRRFASSPKGKEPLFVLEPVEEWRNLPSQSANSSSNSSVNLLDAFYGNIEKFGFCFQTYAFLSRMKLLLETMKRAEEEGRTWIICERSIFTDREIFLESLYENGSITHEERAVYHQLWDFWIGLMQPFFKDIELHFLYVECDPNTSMNHIKSRMRPEEESIDLSYLQTLNSKHEDLYSIENRGNKLYELSRVLIGSQKENLFFHEVNNQHGLVKLYSQLDELVNIIKEHSNFWVINPRQIWKYWDMFWDTN